MLRIKKEKDKNRYKSSQLPQRNYALVTVLRIKILQHSFGFSEIDDEMNTKRFEPRDVDTNEWTLFCQHKVFRIFRTKTQTRIQKTVHV